MGKELVKMSVIVAQSKNRVIGRDGVMPWKLTEDLKYFKSLTMDKPVIMGRKTFESIGKPLPGRTNIVISSGQTDAFGPKVLVVDSFEAAVEAARTAAWDKDVGEFYVIGGGSIYKHAVDIADYLYVTYVDSIIEGDTHFPVIRDDLWVPLIERPGAPVDHNNSHPTRYVTYIRR